LDIPWHRWYQQLAEMNNHEGDLVPLYDKYLAAEPKSAALIYLRGRIDPDWDKQEALYRRAIDADPKLGWPWMGIAANASAQGRWDDCLKAAEMARQLNLKESESLDDLFHEAMMAKGQASALVPRYRAAIAANAQDISSLLLLMEALAASGKSSEIDSAIGGTLARLPAQAQSQVMPFLRAFGLYYSGKLEECAKFCGANLAVKPSPPHLHSLLALGRMKEAADDAVFKGLWNDPFHLLAVSVGFGLDGKAEDAASWRKRGADALRKLGGKTDYGKAAEFLSAKEPPAIEVTRRVFVPGPNRAVIMAALADQFPAKRDMYLAEAARYNVCRKPSYYLIERATQKHAKISDEW
jgi:tetratricopeptide (TPR) repeat protein